MSDPNTQWRYSIQNRDQTSDLDPDSEQSIADILSDIADPVVRALLEQGSVTASQVSLATNAAANGKELWRVLLRVDGVNRDDVFGAAAKLANFASCEVNAWEPPDDLVQSILALFGPETVQLILRAGLLPIEVLADEAVDDFTLSFATPDPTSQAAIQIAASLGVKTRFSFSPESIVHARVSGLGYLVTDPVQDIGAKSVVATPATATEDRETASPQSTDKLGSSNRPPAPRKAGGDAVEPVSALVEEPASNKTKLIADVESIADKVGDDRATNPQPSGEPKITGPEATEVKRDAQEVSLPRESDGSVRNVSESIDLQGLEENASIEPPRVHRSRTEAEQSETIAERVDAPATPNVIKLPLETDESDSAELSKYIDPTGTEVAAANDNADGTSEQEQGDFSNPYVEFLHSDNGEEFMVDDVFADIESAITIVDSTPEMSAKPAEDVLQIESETSIVKASETSALEDVPVATSEPVSEAPAAKVSNKPKPEAVIHTPEVPRDRVVVMLLHKQSVSKESVAEAVRVQREEQPKEALWRLLAQVEGVDRDAVYAEAASVYAFPMADISDPDPNFARLVMETFSEERREMLLSMGLLPLEYDMDTASGSAKLVFATYDPARPDVHRLLQQLKLGRFELKYAPESEIKRITHDIFPRRNEFLDRMTDDPMAMDLGTEFEQDQGGLIDEEALEAEISRSTLINLFEATLLEATRSGASDIHIYPNAKRKVEIHFRNDGRLHRWHVEDKVHPEAFLAVVKDNSTNIDRFERDAAQDGFIQRRIDDALIRFRVSVLPIATASQEIRAESIVIRVLDDRKVLTDLRKLGMLDVALERFDKAIRQPHGMVILTGPTGSGKSTTLVAALYQVVTPAVNVLTVEDPVEYIINGVRQIKLSGKLNLEQALRSILRHDPDVVMVGEMRDQQTAELAIKLANTGHLTFSTLHTNDAPSAVSRLYKMGIEPFLIAYAINLVVAQRLLRTLCPTCKVVDSDPDLVLMKSVGFTEEDVTANTIYKAVNDRSCRTCSGTGYKGRRAMCETLYFSRAIRHLIVESGEAIDEDAIRDMARSEGMLTLQDSAVEIVKMGETSMDELIRVTSSDD